MQIKFIDGTLLECIKVDGFSKFYQNASRDTFEIHISPLKYTLEQVITLFSNESNFKTMIFIADDGSEYVHSNYVICSEMSWRNVLLENATSTADETYENRIVVTLSQKSYAEVQAAIIQDTLDVLVLNSLGV